MDLATASRVSAGRGELAISIPPRTSAPSSRRVTGSGSSTDTLPAAGGARGAAAGEGEEGGRQAAPRARGGKASRAEQGGRIGDQDPLHVRLEHRVEEGLEPA